MSEIDETPSTDAPAEAPVAAPETSPNSGEDASWPKEVQAEFTKKSQALADERRQFQSQQQQWQQQSQQQYQALQQQAKLMQQQRGQQGQQQQTQLLEQLRGMSYLDGATAAQLMERIINEGINPLHQAIQQRDQALSHLWTEYKAMKAGLGQHTNKSAEIDFAGRLTKLRDEHSLPDEEWANEYLKDVYYSHEGNDLDAEYPTMVRSRLDAMRKGFRELDRQAATQAKAKSPFPGKGGEVSFTDGKTGGYKTPEARADELWAMMNPGQNE